MIRVEWQDGWYVVDSAIQIGAGGPMDLDLTSENNQFGYNWHVGPQHQIERRI